ncbi:hypothetical protein [Cellulophaga sp. Hel_I_12]|uniref:hypothetical protein n=1 Tax=Cellulophaga sp. Hel_I_12 TaxID=1249972 RepID=UPI000647C3E7|nr:hypothetical protein [Cellulophaga sp. Hel_I_12]
MLNFKKLPSLKKEGNESDFRRRKGSFFDKSIRIIQNFTLSNPPIFPHLSGKTTSLFLKGVALFDRANILKMSLLTVDNFFLGPRLELIVMLNKKNQETIAFLGFKISNA